MSLLITHKFNTSSKHHTLVEKHFPYINIIYRFLDLGIKDDEQLKMCVEESPLITWVLFDLIIFFEGFLLLAQQFTIPVANFQHMKMFIKSKFRYGSL